VLHRYKYLLVLLLVVLSPAKAEYDIALLCLAQNIYHEARSQPIIEKIAISQVVLNRVNSSKYPNTICKVVYQTLRRGRSIVRDKCQFSWYCDGKSDYPLNLNAWTESIRIAALTMTLKVDFTEGALNYHAVYVAPLWAEDMQPTIRIGSHRFYK
jgi:spore germination cell wall hydrolase CwlJ-like protein